jgi:nicotinamide riboside transporter PnuC
MSNKNRYILTSGLVLALAVTITLHFTGHRNVAFWWASATFFAGLVSIHLMMRR